MTPGAWILSLPVRAYRLTFSSYVGHNCRYQPTCSAYALEALQKHGALRGGCWRPGGSRGATRWADRASTTFPIEVPD